MTKPKPTYLIFIDTNIFLDFYRDTGKGLTLSILEHLEGNHGRVITTNQVEMEYKKNRQGVILEALEKIKPPDWNKLKVPAFLRESKPKSMIDQLKEKVDTQRERLEGRVERVLTNPSQNDRIYQAVQRLFKAGADCHLMRDNDLRFKIRRLARKRFILGYPPRKPRDTSCGDSINWEWIVYCAQHSTDNEGIVIVSRDSDYGVTHGKTAIINDWLRQEFKERVSKKREIVLTERLSEAFELAEIGVTEDEKKAEDELIEKLEEDVQQKRRTRDFAGHIMNVVDIGARLTVERAEEEASDGEAPE